MKMCSENDPSLKSKRLLIFQTKKRFDWTDFHNLENIFDCVGDQRRNKFLSKFACAKNQVVLVAVSKIFSHYASASACDSRRK